MDEKVLCQIGLTPNQARTYRVLLLKQALQPPQLQKVIGESRANCYAILDKLVSMGLATREDENKKLIYRPLSPLLLESIITKNITLEQTKLKQLQRNLPHMLSLFSADKGKPRVTSSEGVSELRQQYERQIDNGKGDIRFIHTRSDIGYFGAELLRNIRWEAVLRGIRRQAISSYKKAFYNPYTDRNARLRRTWLWEEGYTSPVEWAVRDDTLYISHLEGKGFGLEIKHAEIARSFAEIFDLTSNALKATANYKKRQQEVDATIDHEVLKNAADKDNRQGK